MLILYIYQRYRTNIHTYYTPIPIHSTVVSTYIMPVPIGCSLFAGNSQQLQLLHMHGIADMMIPISDKYNTYTLYVTCSLQAKPARDRKIQNLFQCYDLKTKEIMYIILISG